MFQKIAGWFAKNDNNSGKPVDTEKLQKKIEYTFRNQDLLIQAMSHRSYYIDSEKHHFSNERLEFLGDAVLDLIVTDFLFQKFDKENEGLLSQKKAVLVSRKVLGKISQEMQLGEFLILNKGEEKTGGRKRLSNLANLYEALLGAIYLDGGLKSSEKFVKSFLLSRYKELLKTKTYFNYKSSLLEFAQSKGWGPPHYKVVEESGPDHQKMFVVEVFVNEDSSGQGKGPNKKSAEQNAAKNTLKLLSRSHTELVDKF